MKHIIKVNNIQDAKDNPTRPLIAMDSNGVLFAEGKAAGPQIKFVDLGLSVKWGSANLGATNGDTAESWYGKYLMWGELEEKSGWDGQGTKVPYDWTTYKYANGAQNKLTKYCYDSKYGNDGFTDKLRQLVPEDDVATVTNPAWRMPTQAEYWELFALPNEWVTNYNGISGLSGRVFSGNNGNTLFIPAAGCRDGSNINYVGSICFLWTSSLYLDPTYRGYCLFFNRDYIGMDSNNRCHGYPVRPVC